MATATAKRRRSPAPKILTITLREELVRGSKPHPVDRANGIIRHVKVVGKQSPNTHGIHGVEGTLYTTEALEGAKALYEGLKVNIDHPPREKPGKERSSYDRLGKLVDCVVEDGELYADLHLLKAHPMAERLMEAAEKMPDAFALSHNALGKGDVRNKIYVITEIPEVRSVDIVADGGTCASLFEGRSMAKKTTVRKLLERLSKDRKAFDLAKRKRMRSLLEDDSATGMDAEMEEADEAGDHRDHLYNAMKACQESGDDEMAGKIHGLLKPKKAETEEADESDSDEDAETETEEDDESDEETANTEESGSDELRGKNQKGQIKAIWGKDPHGDYHPSNESRQYKRGKGTPLQETRARLRYLETKDSVRELCESLAFVPSATQLKALMGLPTVADRKALIQESKGARTAGGSPPRAGGQSITRTTQESKATPKSADDQAAMLLR